MITCQFMSVPSENKSNNFVFLANKAELKSSVFKHQIRKIEFYTIKSSVDEVTTCSKHYVETELILYSITTLY